jgi:hypothetical protein
MSKNKDLIFDLDDGIWLVGDVVAMKLEPGSDGFIDIHFHKDQLKQVSKVLFEGKPKRFEFQIKDKHVKN